MGSKSIPSKDVPTICICPYCRKQHVKRLYWTGGKVTPRLFCKQHEHLLDSNVEGIDEMESYRVYKPRRRRVYE